MAALSHYHHRREPSALTVVIFLKIALDSTCVIPDTVPHIISFSLLIHMHSNQHETPLYIFGIGQQAECAWYTFHYELKRQVSGFVIDLSEYPNTLLNLPVLPLTQIAQQLQENRAEVFIAIGSIAMNTIREYYFHLLTQLGASVVNCISPVGYRAESTSPIRNFSMDATSVTLPFTKLGDNILLSNARISHHCTIEDNVSINGALIGANCHIGRNSTIALAATIESGVTLGEFCLIDSGVTVKHDLPPYSVVTAPRPAYRSIDSRRVKLFGESYFGFHRKKGPPEERCIQLSREVSTLRKSEL